MMPLSGLLPEKPRIPLREILLHGLLPGFLKVWIYRLKGYKIGKGVRIGLGSVIIADAAEVGDESQIGFLTIVRGKRITIGAHVRIGSTTFLDTPYLEIGDGTRINEQVFVGGLQFPDSRLVVGRNCQIMQMSFINPARSITIGDDTGIGGHCLIFGHTSWLSQFEGYPVDFQPIEIGRSVSLAWRVFVLPGTKIGDGAVVGANSVVSQTVPPRCLTLGFPARVVAKAPGFPRDLSEEDKVGILRNIVAELIGYFRQSGLECDEWDHGWVVRRRTQRWFSERIQNGRMMVVYDDPSVDQIRSANGRVDLLLSLRRIPSDIREMLDEKRVMWIEIDRKEQSRISNELGEEVSYFLRRYGVRTLRV